jgi:hypothetical protein
MNKSLTVYSIIISGLAAQLFLSPYFKKNISGITIPVNFSSNDVSCPDPIYN